jgi:hypothetical protein
MQIFIRHDKTLTLDVEQDSDVQIIRDKIFDKLGFTKEDYYMVCAGKLIGKGKISDYHIVKDSVIHVNLRLR